MRNIYSKHFINTWDNFTLAAILIKPADRPKGIVQINSAMGINKEFYFEFGDFLADHGFLALVYDYRGVGESLDIAREFRLTLLDWGSIDMASVLDWIHIKFPECKKYIVGHGIGGELVGLMNNHRHIRKIFMVGSSSPSIRNVRGGFRNRMLISYRVLIGLFFWLRYVPGSWVGSVERVPASIVKEWLTWFFSENYFTGLHHGPFWFYNKLTAPVKMVYVESDPLTNDRAVAELRQYISKANVETEKMTTQKFGQKETIRSLVFFSSECKEEWAKTIRFFDGTDGY